MTPKQCLELMQYINTNNGWNDNMYENSCERHRIAIKYVRFCLDTRDNRVWLLNFDPGFGEEISFRVENDDDLKSLYAFLDADIRDAK